MTDFDIPEDVDDAGEELAPLFNIDDLIAAKLAKANEAVIVVARIELFGITWNLIESANALHSFHMSNYGKEPMAIINYMLSLVHPTQRDLFATTLEQQAALPVEIILDIFNAMMEAVANRPTSPSPAKPSGSRTRRR